MKKFLSILLLVSLSLTLLVGASSAEESFTFRGIPWLTTRADVKDKLSGEGLKAWWDDKNAAIPDWFQTWSNINGDYTVSEGGCNVAYHGASVAGYTADVNAYFWFPIVEGRVQRDPDLAQFYLATYEVTGIDNMEPVYDDLLTKLTSLYGTPQAKNSDSNWTNTIGSLWTAEDGSLIWLAQYTEYGSITVKIWYAAPKTTETLQALETQIANEIREAEDAEREKNKTNTDGL